VKPEIHFMSILYTLPAGDKSVSMMHMRVHPEGGCTASSTK